MTRYDEDRYDEDPGADDVDDVDDGSPCESCEEDPAAYWCGDERRCADCTEAWDAAPSDSECRATERRQMGIT